MIEDVLMSVKEQYWCRF